MSNSDVYSLAVCASLGLLFITLIKMSRGKNLGFRIGYYLYTRTRLGYMYNQHKLHKARLELGGRSHSICQPVKFGDLTIYTVPYGQTNYAYIVADAADGSTAIIDPGDPVAVQELLKETKLQPSVILTTHKHWDHSAGNSQLKQCYRSLAVYGGANEYVPGATHGVREGDVIECGRLKFRVFSTPGHTTDHVVYVLDASASFNDAPTSIFCGDHMFVGGIGKLFEGSAADMLSSLDKILTLPENSLLFPGHEYALSNLTFAASLEPENMIISSKLQEVKLLREKRQCTSPTTLRDELTYNPFLRTADPRLVAALNISVDQQKQQQQREQLSDSDTADVVDKRVAVLAECRRLKDNTASDAQ